MNRRSLLSLGLAAPLYLAMRGVARAGIGETPQLGPQFGIDLLRTVAANQPGSILTSPLSLAAALMVTAVGAEGRTRRSFARTLRVPYTSFDDATRELRDSLVRLLDAGDGNTFASAQGVWVRAGLAVEPNYLQQQQKLFGIEVSPVNFAAPETTRIINQWFSERTRERIREVVGDLDGSTQFLVADATYFKGAWHTKFDPSRTTGRRFTAADGSSRSVPTMEHKSIEGDYFEDAQVQALRLPFQGHKYTMTLLLPRKSSTVDQLLASDAANLGGLLSGRGTRPGQGRLRLPRFDLTGGGSITSAVQTLGLKPAFEPNADFSAMTDDPTSLSEVIQKVALTVDEVGAEAAAATAVTATRSAVPRRPIKFDMEVNRPFIVSIQHRDVTLPLVLARIATL